MKCDKCGYDDRGSGDMAHMCETSVPRDQIEIVLMRAQIELLQRVNRLIDLLEKQYK